MDTTSPDGRRRLVGDEKTVDGDIWGEATVRTRIVRHVVRANDTGRYGCAVIGRTSRETHVLMQTGVRCRWTSWLECIQDVLEARDKKPDSGPHVTLLCCAHLHEFLQPYKPFQVLRNNK